MDMSVELHAPSVQPPTPQTISAPAVGNPSWPEPALKHKPETVDLFGSLVRDIMTQKVVTVGPGETLRFAATVLTEKKISGVPVVDKEGKVLGVLSEKDILRQLHEKAGLSVPGGLLELILEPSSARRADTLTRCATVLNEVLVAVAMSKPARTIHPDSPSIQAVRDMLIYRINRLPVVDHGQLVGIVTRSDVLRLGQGG